MVVLLAALAGLLLSGAFVPLGWWFLAPLSFVLLFIALESRGLAWRLASMFSYSFVCFAVVLHWSSTYVGVLPWFLLTCLESIFFLPLAFITPIRSWRIFLFPSSWILIEELRSHFPFGGFGWGRVAFSQSNSPLVSIASIGGGPLLSFITISMALVIYLFIRHKYRQGVYVAVLVAIVGALPLMQSRTISAGTIEVAAVQAGVKHLGLNFNERAAQVFYDHLALSRQYLISTRVKPDVMIWPENAIDIDPTIHVEIGRELSELANAFQVPIIAGAVLGESETLRNASILWRPKVGLDGEYIKNHLTPFGEYMPLRSLAEFISPFAQKVSDFHPGSDVHVHSINSARISPIICFDLLDDGLVTRSTKQGNVIALQTNSATFGQSAQSAQEFAIARIRAVEHGRSIISISTSGVSGFIDRSGQFSSLTTINQAVVISKRVQLFKGTTVSDRYRPGITWSVILLPYLAALALLRRRGRKI